MIRTHKIALKPNKEQATLLSQHCGYARVAYNYVVEKFNTALDAGDPFDFYVFVCQSCGMVMDRELPIFYDLKERKRVYWRAKPTPGLGETRPFGDFQCKNDCVRNAR